MTVEHRPAQSSPVLKQVAWKLKVLLRHYFDTDQRTRLASYLAFLRDCRLPDNRLDHFTLLGAWRAAGFAGDVPLSANRFRDLLQALAKVKFPDNPKALHQLLVYDVLPLATGAVLSPKSSAGELQPLRFPSVVEMLAFHRHAFRQMFSQFASPEGEEFEAQRMGLDGLRRLLRASGLSNDAGGVGDEALDKIFNGSCYEKSQSELNYAEFCDAIVLLALHLAVPDDEVEPSLPTQDLHVASALRKLLSRLDGGTGIFAVLLPEMAVASSEASPSHTPNRGTGEPQAGPRVQSRMHTVAIALLARNATPLRYIYERYASVDDTTPNVPVFGSDCFQQFSRDFHVCPMLLSSGNVLRVFEAQVSDITGAETQKDGASLSFDGFVEALYHAAQLAFNRADWGMDRSFAGSGPSDREYVLSTEAVSLARLLLHLDFSGKIFSVVQVDGVERLLDQNPAIGPGLAARSSHQAPVRDSGTAPTENATPQSRSGVAAAATQAINDALAQLAHRSRVGSPLVLGSTTESKVGESRGASVIEPSSCALMEAEASQLRALFDFYSSESSSEGTDRVPRAATLVPVVTEGNWLRFLRESDMLDNTFGFEASRAIFAGLTHRVRPRSAAAAYALCGYVAPSQSKQPGQDDYPIAPAGLRVENWAAAVAQAGRAKCGSDDGVRSKRLGPTESLVAVLSSHVCRLAGEVVALRRESLLRKSGVPECEIALLTSSIRPRTPNSLEGLQLLRPPSRYIGATARRFDSLLDLANNSSSHSDDVEVETWNERANAVRMAHECPPTPEEKVRSALLGTSLEGDVGESRSSLRSRLHACDEDTSYEVASLGIAKAVDRVGSSRVWLQTGMDAARRERSRLDMLAKRAGVQDYSSELLRVIESWDSDMLVLFSFYALNEEQRTERRVVDRGEHKENTDIAAHVSTVSPHNVELSKICSLSLVRDLRLCSVAVGIEAFECATRWKRWWMARSSQGALALTELTLTYPDFVEFLCVCAFLRYHGTHVESTSDVAVDAASAAANMWGGILLEELMRQASHAFDARQQESHNLSTSAASRDGNCESHVDDFLSSTAPRQHEHALTVVRSPQRTNAEAELNARRDREYAAHVVSEDGELWRLWNGRCISLNLRSADGESFRCELWTAAEWMRFCAVLSSGNGEEKGVKSPWQISLKGAYSIFSSCCAVHAAEMLPAQSFDTGVLPRRSQHPVELRALDRDEFVAALRSLASQSSIASRGDGDLDCGVRDEANFVHLLHYILSPDFDSSTSSEGSDFVLVYEDGAVGEILRHLAALEAVFDCYCDGRKMSLRRFAEDYGLSTAFIEVNGLPAFACDTDDLVCFVLRCSVWACTGRRRSVEEGRSHLLRLGFGAQRVRSVLREMENAAGGRIFVYLPLHDDAGSTDVHTSPQGIGSSSPQSIGVHDPASHVPISPKPILRSTPKMTPRPRPRYVASRISSPGAAAERLLVAQQGSGGPSTHVVERLFESFASYYSGDIRSPSSSRIFMSERGFQLFCWHAGLLSNAFSFDDALAAARSASAGGVKVRLSFETFLEAIATIAELLARQIGIETDVSFEYFVQRHLAPLCRCPEVESHSCSPVSNGKEQFRQWRAGVPNIPILVHGVNADAALELLCERHDYQLRRLFARHARTAVVDEAHSVVAEVRRQLRTNAVLTRSGFLGAMLAAGLCPGLTDERVCRRIFNTVAASCQRHKDVPKPPCALIEVPGLEVEAGLRAPAIYFPSFLECLAQLALRVFDDPDKVDSEKMASSSRCLKTAVQLLLSSMAF